MRVCHVITGLSTGGAEMMLLKLVTTQPNDPAHTLVISLLDEGTIGPRLAQAGITVRTLGMQRARPTLGSLMALRRAIAEFRPDLVQGWMYHGNLAASLANRLAGSQVPVVWNIRQTVYRLEDNSRATSLLIRAGAMLSRRPRAIVYNSRTSRDQHRVLGYHEERSLVIPNGFDLTRFSPNTTSRAAVRRELGLADETPLIGLVARYDPMKDFPTALRAMADVVHSRPDAHLVAAGRDVTPGNAELVALVRDLGIAANVSFAGEVADTPRLMAALDVYCSSSAWGEGFPNVIGEAMACGVSCVATDVGDTRYIVGDTGEVVPPRDSSSLGEALTRALQMSEEEHARIGAAARARIAAHFSLSDVVHQYDTLYRGLIRPLESR